MVLALPLSLRKVEPSCIFYNATITATEKLWGMSCTWCYIAHFFRATYIALFLRDKFHETLTTEGKLLNNVNLVLTVALIFALHQLTCFCDPCF